MYFHLVMDQWGNNAAWPTIHDVYFGDIPKLLRLIITRGLRAKLMKEMLAQGLGRLSPAERMECLEPDLQAISYPKANSYLDQSPAWLIQASPLYWQPCARHRSKPTCRNASHLTNCCLITSTVSTQPWVKAVTDLLCASSLRFCVWLVPLCGGASDQRGKNVRHAEPPCPQQSAIRGQHRR